MTTSGTYTFNPSLGSLTVHAYQMLQMRPSQLLAEHMDAARMATNLLLSRWSSMGVDLWKVELVTVPLVQGAATYSVDPSTITMLDAYITTGTGTTATDRIILPVSRTEYASYPNKQQQGFPTTFWFDRLLNPTVTLYPVPDGNQTYLNYYRLVQNQDANLINGQTVEIPYYFLEALCFGLAARLAMIWKPELATALKAAADESYQIAANQNVEQSSFYISPVLQGYWQ